MEQQSSKSWKKLILDLCAVLRMRKACYEEGGKVEGSISYFICPILIDCMEPSGRYKRQDITLLQAIIDNRLGDTSRLRPNTLRQYLCGRYGRDHDPYDAREDFLLGLIIHEVSEESQIAAPPYSQYAKKELSNV